MTVTVISTEDVSKSYRMGEIGAGTFYGDLRRWWAGQRGKSAHPRDLAATSHDRLDGETIWALRHVNFTVREGDAVGIIGRNGAGKSTLLRILSRVTAPTSGVVRIKGHVASLLEVGTGFHPDLTGRENIFLNGAIMGMTRNEVRKKFDEIVDFSGVESFVDTPVKRYSSGMYVRLAFAVAAHLDPEILIVDEVLAVGDAQFQKKCLGKMDAAARNGRTVLFVSHNLSAVSRLCETTMWIDGGKLIMKAPTDEVVSAYLNRETVSLGQKRWQDGLSQPGVDEFAINEASIMNAENEVTSAVSAEKPFSINIRYTIKKKLPYCRIGFAIHTESGELVLESYDSDDSRYAGPREVGEYYAHCIIPGNFLNTTRYFISIKAGMPGIKFLAGADNILSIDIENVGAVGSHLPDFGRKGIVRPMFDWHQRKATNGEPLAS